MVLLELLPEPKEMVEVVGAEVDMPLIIMLVVPEVVLVDIPEMVEMVQTPIAMPMVVPVPEEVVEVEIPCHHIVEVVVE
jgi:hypothetical protein